MQQRISLTEKQKSYILAAVLAGLNFLVFLIPALRSYTFENRAISLLAAGISTLIFLIHIPICIFLRFHKKMWIARGIFLYQLIGALAYVIFFFGYVAGNASTAFFSACYNTFRHWTLWYEPLVVTLSRLIGIPLKFTMGILYLILIEITGSTITAIRKDIRYEREREEDRAYEEATRGRGGPWQNTP